MKASEETTLVCVKINPNKASLRTRNRVKEGGPDFAMYENSNRPGSVLLRSPKTGWFGWLPLNEIVINETKETQ
jgi:hypothetical protein